MMLQAQGEDGMVAAGQARRRRCGCGVGDKEKNALRSPAAEEGAGQRFNPAFITFGFKLTLQPSHEENMTSNGNLILVGTKVSNRLRDQLDASLPSMKPFFNEKDPAFLQVLRIDDDEYIGKLTASGASLEMLGNMLLNVKSMLRMICPAFVLPDDAIRVFALTPAMVGPLAALR